LLVPEILQLVP